MKSHLTEKLKSKGWTEVEADWHYKKDEWVILRDTSSWLMLGDNSNPRIFDIPEPEEINVSWTISLIEHLFKIENERRRLRKALSTIKDKITDKELLKILNDSLEDCYHTWIIRKQKMYCPI